ncbi:MAG: glycerol-3-phosphate acyltransferase, partial [Melioribacteraceae bacterium]|nr:glycerol-3-phosphate acyltransferase [Melioribacteraceae bacterium]
WIKFKGGRGLATAAGGALLISPIILVIWASSWKLIHIIKKDIHLANILATFSVIICSIIFNNWLNQISIVKADSGIIFTFSVSLLMLIILSKHVKPLKDYLKNSNRI